MFTLEIALASQLVGVQKSFFKHQTENLFCLFGAINLLEESQIFQEETDQKCIFGALPKKIDELWHRIFKERSSFLHPFCYSLFGLQNNAFKWLEVVLFIAGFPELRFVLKILGPIDFHMLKV